MTDAVRVETEGALLHVVLARPRARNALDHEMQLQLVAAFERAAVSDPVRAVLLRAEGEHFCAGADLAVAGGERPRRPGHLQRTMPQRSQRAILAIWHAQVPVVAAVRGHAAGMGCSLALACDFVVASETATFSLPFVRLGVAADTGSPFLLPRLVGLARAKEMLLLGRPVSGELAAAWGLVSAAVPDADVERAAHALAVELATGATVAIGLTKALLHGGLDQDLARAMADEGLAQELAVRTKDFREGVESRTGKRPPQFLGE